jgi:hypothetical protein
MFGISPLGWVHTLGSLPALPLALAMVVRYGRIEPRSWLGRAYLAVMVLGAVTVYPLAHARAGVILASVTLGLLLVGYAARAGRAPGRGALYVETIALSLTVFLLLLPTVTEVLRRVPDGHPIVTDLASPILRAAHLTLVVGLVVGLVVQVRRLRRTPRS